MLVTPCANPKCTHHAEDHAGLDSYGKCVMPGCQCEEYKPK